MTSRIPASLRVIGRSIVDWWDGWLDFVMISIVWLLAQVTIILGPPATFGAYYVAHSMLNGESLGVRGLIEGARKYFGKALLWGVLNWAVAALFVVNYQFYGSIQAAVAPYIRVFVITVMLVWLSTQFYALAFFMEQEDKRLRVALRNGVLTTLAAPFFSLILLILTLFLLGFSIALVLPAFLGLPGLIPVLGIRAMSDRLITFGIRQREKTPKEIEFEQSGHIDVPVMDRLFKKEDAAASEHAAEGEHTEGE